MRRGHRPSEDGEKRGEDEDGEGEAIEARRWTGLRPSEGEGRDGEDEDRVESAEEQEVDEELRRKGFGPSIDWRVKARGGARKTREMRTDLVIPPAYSRSYPRAEMVEREDASSEDSVVVRSRWSSEMTVPADPANGLGLGRYPLKKGSTGFLLVGGRAEEGGRGGGGGERALLEGRDDRGGTGDDS